MKTHGPITGFYALDSLMLERANLRVRLHARETPTEEKVEIRRRLTETNAILAELRTVLGGGV